MGSQDIEILREDIRRLTDKVERITRDLPDYVRKVDFAPVQQQVQAIDDKINNLHNSSMAWVNDSFDKTKQLLAETERRLIDKYETRTEAGWGQRVTLIFASAGWVITLAVLVIERLWH